MLALEGLRIERACVVQNRTWEATSTRPFTNNSNKDSILMLNYIMHGYNMVDGPSHMVTLVALCGLFVCLFVIL